MTHPMHPLAPLPSIKLKIGTIILAAVGVTIVVFWAGTKVGLWPSVSGIIAGICALVITRYLARGLTSPLREMSEATTAMARGDYERRVNLASKDEIGQLAASFNQMAAELDATERMRRDLIANVSHELRTPITALQAVLENMIDGVEPADPETMRTMLAQVERLGRLVAQLLDLSRLESGSMPLDRQSFEIEAVLEHAARETRLHSPNAIVSVDVEPGGLTADADPERLHQVVANLLENALRYTPIGGTVELRAFPAEPSGITIEVTDEGPGIPDDQVPRIFERFYRADSARSSRDGGAGLGLAIAQWIVDLHGGEIHPERREPHGCRMVVTLPGARTATAVREPVHPGGT